jgi:LPXTG-motif cell wall-anchored protein
MTKKEKCTKEGDLWAYDCSKVSLKSNEDYCLCFAADPSKIQTYDTTFSEKCFGDTVKLTGNKIENPVDSEKKADEAVWTKNSGSYGPHLAFTSIGNIVGSKLCPNEKGTEVIGDWVPTYYKSTYIKDKVATLAKAYPRFGIKDANDITTIYAYILQKKTGEDEAAMKKLLEDAFAKAYPSKKGVKIDTKKAKSQAESIKKSGGHVTSSSSSSAGSSSAGASGSSSGSSYSSGSSNSSGSGSDGEEDTIFFVLFGVMAAAAGVIFVTRRKRTE